MHSAVHHQGRRLYDFAREGVEVERTARRVEIFDLAREAFAGTRLELSVTCSKGTYIRTLAMDIGEALGCGAYLTALRRTAVGAFRIEDAVTLDMLEREGAEASRERLRPVDVLVDGLVRWDAPEAQALWFTQGQAVDCDGAEPGEERAVFAPGGRFLGVGRCEARGRLLPDRLMATGPSEVA